MTPFVVVSGLPASGKTTIGRLIAERTDRALLDKDDILESLFPADFVQHDERSRLSRLADDHFIERARSLDRGVLVSFWRQPLLSMTSGTPTEWLADLPGLVEVHCACPADICAERFSTRARHPGHGDMMTTREELARRFADLAAAGPIGIASTITIDTSIPLDAPTLAQLSRL